MQLRGTDSAVLHAVPWPQQVREMFANPKRRYFDARVLPLRYALSGKLSGKLLVLFRERSCAPLLSA